MLAKRRCQAWGAGRRVLSWLVACCLVALALLRPAWAATAVNPAQGPGGPILVLTNGSADYGAFYAEILRTEGFNAFRVADVSTLDASLLAGHDLVLLARTALTAAQATVLGDWVQGGGNLIAMAPDAQLLPLLGLAGASATAATPRHLMVDTTTPVGQGITGRPMQFHGPAALYGLAGATALASLHDGVATALSNPAVSLHRAGAGSAAAFAYDLATSVVLTRQGNPRSGFNERDPHGPIRSKDFYLGTGSQRDWVDFDKLDIPQADEQQRLLAKLVTHMNLARKPLPRFWYFPDGHKAVVVMTGDDHGNNGTQERFERFRQSSPAGCSVARWECVRGTSYIFPRTPIPPQVAEQFARDGFEIGLHANSGCADYSATSLRQAYADQTAAFRQRFPNLPPLLTQRHHCVAWSDWTTGAQVQAQYGMRLDTSYYYWPPQWASQVPGVFTGSAMPMRFMQENGALLDVYQAATQMTDESGQAYPFTVDTLLGRALGLEGFYGAYVVNAHTDVAESMEADAVIASARAHRVPVIAASQLLTWLDARNAAAFSALAWDGTALRFTVGTAVAGAPGLQALLPWRSAGGVLKSVTRNGQALTLSLRHIKGVEQVFFPAEAGSYVAAYVNDGTGLSGAADGEGSTLPPPNQEFPTVPGNPSVADFNAVEVGVKFRADVAGFVTAIRFYKGPNNTGTHRASLWRPGQSAALLTRTVENETAGGWQTVPVCQRVEPGVVYVASYHAPNGGYAGDNYFFARAGVDRGQLKLLQSGVSGDNGVYAYSAEPRLPTQSYRSSNYWVDVSFEAGDSASCQAGSASVAGGAAGGGTGGSGATGGATPTPIGEGSAPGGGQGAGATAVVSPQCVAPANAIVAENCKAGSPRSDWDVVGAGDPGIQGFATQMSVNRGTTVHFKVQSSAAAWRLDIYRLGFYGGNGARKVASVPPSVSLPQAQPRCLTEAATGLVDCGNWAVSASWAVPATATSGIYVARAVRADTGGASHIVFVVRDDASRSDLVFQTSDTTWQAYNTWGGNSFYQGGPGTQPPRAYKLSYNRPFNTRAVQGGQDWLFHAEVPMLRWLEANGYDVSYISGIDTDRAGAPRLRQHKTFLSVGHDEYWSGAQRANVEAARDAGLNLAFFSGNEVYWKTRWEPSIDGSFTPHRTLVSYKETHANAKLDPHPDWTGTWRDPRFSPPYDGGRPENALTGTLFMNNDTGVSYAITVPAEEGKLRFWRHTGIASLPAGASATLSSGVLGYEWDTDADNGARPPGLMRLSRTTLSTNSVLLNWGSAFGPGTVTHALTLYRHAGGARVFGAGTVQWPWGLDATHDYPTANYARTAVDPRMQQATVNLLADMGAQPGTLQVPLVAATASTDFTPPAALIATPAAGAVLAAGQALTVTGTASDSGGEVGAVEVSVDGGATWRPANGRAHWTFTWTPTAPGAATLLARAVDDSGNLQPVADARAVTVAALACPCTAFSADAIPAVAAAADAGAVNLGVKFRAGRSGFITGIRFFKGAGNGGAHVGALWRADGTRLATVTFTNESASGWQQADFAAPVPVEAGAVYVASYHAPQGRYAVDTGFFSAAAVDSGPLQLLRDGAGGGNGVYAYGPGLLFPASSFRSSNYWVDVVFQP